jgi:hypothetical protein
MKEAQKVEESVTINPTVKKSVIENTNPNNGQILKPALKKESSKEISAVATPGRDLGMGIFSPLKTTTKTGKKFPGIFLTLSPNCTA